MFFLVSLFLHVKSLRQADYDTYNFVVNHAFNLWVWLVHSTMPSVCGCGDCAFFSDVKGKG